MERTVMMASVMAAIATFAGCESCPETSLAITVTPSSVERGTQTTLSVAFPEPVFVGTSPEREAGIFVMLYGPTNGPESLYVRWDPTASPDPEIPQVTVVDERTLELEVLLPVSANPGPYHFEVVAQRGSVCNGPNGSIVLDVR